MNARLDTRTRQDTAVRDQSRCGSRPGLAEAPESDTRLIDRALDGDVQAFGRLAARHQDRLANAMYYVVGNRSDVEDVVQDALVQSYVKLSTFRRKSAFYTWLYRIAFNLATNAKRRRRPSISLEDTREAMSIGTEDDSPNEKCEQDERAVQVHTALSSLEPKLRAVLVLRDMQGHSYQTIAQMVDVPIGTVRSRIHRGRMELRRKLEPELKP